MTTSTELDIAGVAAVPGRIVEAWANHDAQAFADVFTEDGSMVLPGEVNLSGREAIKEYMAQAFAGPYAGTQVVGTPVALPRALGDGAAVVVSEGGVVAAGDTEPTPDQAVYATWVLENTPDGWQLAAYHNSPKNA